MSVTSLTIVDELPFSLASTSDAEEVAPLNVGGMSGGH
jgi:hypothetical protein